MLGKKEYSSINGLLDKRLSENEFLIAVHRGTSTGNIAQNTYLSSKLSLQLGGDMFEIDLSNSTDGELYIFHDGGEKRILGIDRNIKELSSAEIDALEFRNWLGEPSGRHVETFDSILRRIDDDWLFNIDRSWWFLPDVDKVMQRYPERIRQAVIKTHVKDEYLSFFASCPRKYMYMPIVYTIEEEERVIAADGVNLVGMELIASRPDDPIISRENIMRLRDSGLYVWINTIKLGSKPEHVLSGGFDDDKAIEDGMDSSWGVLLDRGANVLQTDWPTLMKWYRDRRK